MAFLIPIIPVGTRPQRTPRAKPPSQVLSLTQPQQTLYVRNLTEEHSTEQVHASLTSLFSQHGSLLGVKAKRNIRHRGQAFVSFDSVDAATRAMHALQGYFLFEKPMVSLLIQDIQYAREPAFAVSETNGTLDDHNRMRVESKPSREKPLVKKPKRSNLSKPVTLEDHLPPNSILFVQNLPPGTKEAAIIAMFQQFPGFKEVRSVPGRTDIVFVEYESELSAGVAKQTLHGYRLIPTLELRVAYARK